MISVHNPTMIRLATHNWNNAIEIKTKHNLNNLNYYWKETIKPRIPETVCSSVGVRLIKNTKLNLQILKFLW